MSIFSPEKYSSIYFQRLASFIGLENLSRPCFPDSEEKSRTLSITCLFAESFKLIKSLSFHCIHDRSIKATYVFFDSKRFSSSTVKSVITNYDHCIDNLKIVDLVLPSDPSAHETLFTFLFLVVIKSNKFSLFLRLLYYISRGCKQGIADTFSQALQSTSFFNGSSFYFLTSNSTLTDLLKISLASLGFPTFEVMHAVGSRPALKMYQSFSSKTAHRILFIPPYPDSLCPTVYRNLKCSHKYLNLALAGQTFSSDLDPKNFVSSELLDSIISNLMFLASPVLVFASQAGFSAESESEFGLLEAKVYQDIYLQFKSYNIDPIILISRHPNSYNSLRAYSALLSKRFVFDIKIKFLSYFVQGLLLCDHFISFDSSTAWDASLASVPASIFQDCDDNSLYDEELLASINHPLSLHDSSAYLPFLKTIVEKSISSFGDRISRGFSLSTFADMRMANIRKSCMGSRDTLEKPSHLRDNGPVIAGQDWADGRQTARLLGLRAHHGQEADQAGDISL